MKYYRIIHKDSLRCLSDNSTVPIPSPHPLYTEYLDLLSKGKATVFTSSMNWFELRQKAYPSLEDQVAALWDGDEAVAAMKKQIQDIKKKYPKT